MKKEFMNVFTHIEFVSAEEYVVGRELQWKKIKNLIMSYLSSKSLKLSAVLFWSDIFFLWNVFAVVVGFMHNLWLCLC